MTRQSDRNEPKPVDLVPPESLAGLELLKDFRVLSDAEIYDADGSFIEYIPPATKHREGSFEAERFVPDFSDLVI